jgi:hypothetical protein
MRNVSVVLHTPENVVFKHDAGYLNLKLQDLPPELQKRFPYDAAKAAAYRKQNTLRQQLDASTARDLELRQKIQALEQQQEGIRARMRIIRGKPGTPDKGRMQNFQREVDLLETQKQTFHAELNTVMQNRLLLQQEAAATVAAAATTATTTTSPGAPEKKKAKKKKK